MKPFYYFLLSISFLTLLFLLSADLLLISNILNAEEIVKATNWMPSDAPSTRSCGGDIDCIANSLENLGKYLQNTNVSNFSSLYIKEITGLLIQSLIYTAISSLVFLFAGGKLNLSKRSWMLLTIIGLIIIIFFFFYMPKLALAYVTL